ncbi:hypothetical protein [Idiomarina sp.]|uniref:hypothetical protein n=1 Tax=Idiomarina sp. TaxID=1874361 RepID=UPI0025C57B0E|nr:hypothetical protein [Idiomarina sp.]NQZ03475.1 hypothetical protein [Idiomarina sp.]
MVAKKRLKKRSAQRNKVKQNIANNTQRSATTSATSQVQDLKTLQHELDDALKLINQYSSNHENSSGALMDQEGLNNTQSLLDRCAAIVNADSENKKPTLRIIHHFACSGGTLISKCLAAQPNVFLLSELHPTTRHGNDWSKADYTPRDVITQAFYSGIPQADKLAEEVFVENIIKTEMHTRRLGGTLVIRAHSHADYCMRVPQPDIDTVTRLLQPYFEIEQLVTVRNPIDSFASLRENRWVHFQPNTFEEYCQRLLKFLKAFKTSQIFYYEKFVSEPDRQIKKYTELLQLPMVEHAAEYIDVLKVSGDSGRSGLNISPRARKPISDEYKSEILQSKTFKMLCQQYDIEPLAE